MKRGRKKGTAENLENPTTEAVLNLLKAGLVIATVFLFPGAAKTINDILLKKREYEYEPWKKFNQRRLRQVVKRLVKRKVLSIEEKNGESIVTITESGEKEVLRYKLEKLKIKKPENWDGKWHVVIFDVGVKKNRLRNILREKMRTLGFFPLQKSVFIHPYPCEKEIAFLRQVYHVGNEVSVFTATALEEEDYLKRHFQLLQDY